MGDVHQQQNDHGNGIMAITCHGSHDAAHAGPCFAQSTCMQIAMPPVCISRHLALLCIRQFASLTGAFCYASTRLKDPVPSVACASQHPSFERLRHMRRQVWKVSRRLGSVEDYQCLQSAARWSPAGGSSSCLDCLPSPLTDTSQALGVAATNRQISSRSEPAKVLRKAS